MRFSLFHWRPGHLLAAWSAYWLGLAAVTLTPIVLAVFRATRSGGPPGTANVSASFGDGAIGVTVSRTGHTLIERSAGLLPIALWIAVPPLALWGAWMFARSRALARGERPPVGGASSPERLGAPAPEWDAGARKKTSDRSVSR